MIKYYFFFLLYISNVKKIVILCTKILHLYSCFFMFLFFIRAPPFFLFLSEKRRKKMNNIRPKRRKSKDNPYTLTSNIKKNIYLITFKDVKGICHEEYVTKEIFEAMNKFELEDLSILNEYDNHIEHSVIYENNLNNRAFDKDELIDDLVERKIILDIINKEINDLPDIQKRRIKKHYFYKMTYEEIAKEEKCTKRAVKFSVDIGIEKFSNKIKK